MDKEQLSQLKYLNKEIELLKKQIDNIGYNTVTDSVKGSSIDFPYTLHNIEITGIDIDEYNRKLIRIKRKLSRRIDELMDLYDEINDYIGNIEYSEVRQVLTLRYVNNLSWEQVAAHMGGRKYC